MGLENIKGWRLHLSGHPTPLLACPGSEKVSLYIKLQPLLLLLFQRMAISFQPPIIHGCEVSGASFLLTSLQALKGCCYLTSSRHSLSTASCTGGPKMDTAFQKQPTTCQVKKNHLPQFAGYVPANTASYASMPGHSAGACLAQSPSGHPDPFSRVVPQPVPLQGTGLGAGLPS